MTHYCIKLEHGTDLQLSGSSKAYILSYRITLQDFWLS